MKHFPFGWVVGRHFCAVGFVVLPPCSTSAFPQAKQIYTIIEQQCALVPLFFLFPLTVACYQRLHHGATYRIFIVINTIGIRLESVDVKPYYVIARALEHALVLFQIITCFDFFSS